MDRSSLRACVKNRSSRGNEALIYSKRRGFQDSLSLVTSAATREKGFLRHPLSLSRCRWQAALAPLLGLAATVASAQDTLPRTQFRSGEEILRAFAPVSEATRHSIVKFHVDGETVA